VPSLRELLEVSWALPADVADDGTVLVRWNLPGSFQLYVVAPGGGEPVPRAVAFMEEILGRKIGTE
jgi:hypothetical protein